MEIINEILVSLEAYPLAMTLVQLVVFAVVVWLVNVLTRLLLLHVIYKHIQALLPEGDEALGRSILYRLANLMPALFVFYGIGMVSGLSEDLVRVIRGIASALAVVVITFALAHLLNLIGDLYAKRNPDRARAHPIKGYLQVVKIIAYLVAAILMIAALFNKNPLLLLSGLGAMTAVLMLVFKDTILSLVASVQLSSNDMLRVGDWIAIPQLNADGFVIDISLHTVKVQNWNKTITTIPTWRLINDSYINWRGMYDSGGRQISRALYLDQTSVRFLSHEERQHLQRFALLHDYLGRKNIEISDYNQKLFEQGRDPVNARNMTNLGTFRAYVQSYIEAHPGINTEMFRLVRQLQPGPTGLPLQIYCYTSDTAWAAYENIQSDIFDHLYAILPEFGLRVFQQPSGADLTNALAVLKSHDSI